MNNNTAGGTNNNKTQNNINQNNQNVTNDHMISNNNKTININLIGKIKSNNLDK